MKKKEEPNATKEEIKTENNQPRELTEEELAQVSGGLIDGKVTQHIDNYNSFSL